MSVITRYSPAQVADTRERTVGPAVTSRSAAQLGFWSAILTAILSAAWTVALMYQQAVAPLPKWHGGALLFAAPIFAGGRMERWIRRLFVAMGVVGVAQLAVGMFDLPGSLSLIYGPDWIVGVPLAAVLLAIVFQRGKQLEGSAL